MQLTLGKKFAAALAFGVCLARQTSGRAAMRVEPAELVYSAARAAS